VTTNAVSKIVQIPTSAALDAFFVARMACHPSSTVPLLANARQLAAQFFYDKKMSSDPGTIQSRGK